MVFESLLESILLKSAGKFVSGIDKSDRRSRCKSFLKGSFLCLARVLSINSFFPYLFTVCTMILFRVTPLKTSPYKTQTLTWSSLVSYSRISNGHAWLSLTGYRLSCWSTVPSSRRLSSFSPLTFDFWGIFRWVCWCIPRLGPV